MLVFVFLIQFQIVWQHFAVSIDYEPVQAALPDGTYPKPSDSLVMWFGSNRFDLVYFKFTKVTF